jgi:hypothetical protein
VVAGTVLVERKLSYNLLLDIGVGIRCDDLDRELAKVKQGKHDNAYFQGKCGLSAFQYALCDSATSTFS